MFSIHYIRCFYFFATIAGSVIRMFQHVVTEEMNREALSRYLKTK